MSCRYLERSTLKARAFRATVSTNDDQGYQQAKLHVHDWTIILIRATAAKATPV
jgi:hypothetical protein